MHQKNTSRIAICMGISFIVFLLIASVISIYKRDEISVPVLIPSSWVTGGAVEHGILVNNVISEHKPVPYSYYDVSVCVPDPRVRVSSLLGANLMGNRLEESDFKILMKNDIHCQELCTKTVPTKKLKKLERLIDFEYRAQWELDSLPVGFRNTNNKIESTFNIGKRVTENDSSEMAYAKLYNHFKIKISYHLKEETSSKPESEREYYIVLVEVEPMSIDYQKDMNPESYCTIAENSKANVIPLRINSDNEQEIKYTYSIQWVEDKKTSHLHRWNNYYDGAPNGTTHWFSVINSILVVLFLSIMVGMILTRTLKKDFSRINADDSSDIDETAWKLVHQDVFRPPKRRMILSASVSTGIQIIAMSFFTLVCSILGFISPSHRGELLTVFLVVFVWMGIVAGYVSGRVYKIMEGKNWKKNILLTSTLYPSLLFGITFGLNFLFIGAHSSGAIPFGTFLACIALWFCISIPLCFIGGYFAQKKDAPELPTDVNSIPKYIPDLVWYMRPIPSILLGGILPFGAVFIEVYFIMSSIWHQQEYYLFGFLFIVFLILIITCAEITIVMCYFQLCAQDYKWWWRSFLMGACSGFYLFLYSIIHMVTSLDLEGFLSVLLYLGYSFIIAIIFSLLTGSIGFISCYYFVRRIYSEIRAK
eukprot:TRINITY_DN4525_c0_g2_i1.p1 TRINITY_DN4525_c0_g2~~TRINITY_DN4525_c0_g2_i1.p1  ORF type:complete len:659 (-),score=115.62 TRINITY_DN4525_c0_g2_i1:21-1964(-)